MSSISIHQTQYKIDYDKNILFYSKKQKEWIPTFLEFLHGCFLKSNTIIYGQVYYFYQYSRNQQQQYNYITLSLRRMVKGSKMNVVHLVKWKKYDYIINNIPYVIFLGKVL